MLIKCYTFYYSSLFIYYKIVHEVHKYIVMQYLKKIYIYIKLCNRRDSMWQLIATQTVDNYISVTNGKPVRQCQQTISHHHTFSQEISLLLTTNCTIVNNSLNNKTIIVLLYQLKARTAAVLALMVSIVSMHVRCAVVSLSTDLYAKT